VHEEAGVIVRERQNEKLKMREGDELLNSQQSNNQSEKYEL
jgi:hypothetical protein